MTSRRTPKLTPKRSQKEPTLLATHYIPHSLVLNITPEESTEGAHVRIEIRDGRTFFTSKKYTVDGNGMSGHFLRSDTGFYPGSVNDDAAKLAAHG